MAYQNWGNDPLIKSVVAFSARANTQWQRQWARAGPALYAEGRRIMARSQLLVPVRTGRLKASGTVYPPGGAYRGNTVYVVLGYYEDYAAYVHESLYVQHPHGQAKFLELPFKEAAEGFAQRIGARIVGKG